MPENTLIAVPVIRSVPPPAEQVEAAVRAGADLVELRVDGLNDISAVETLLGGPRRLPMIVTVRAAGEGGAWRGSEHDRIALLLHLARLHPDYIDVELATWEQSAEIRQSLAPARHAETGGGVATRLIISHHDFHETPNDLTSLFARLEAAPADVIKAVFMPRDALDALRLLAEMRRLNRAGRRAVVFGLGEAGLLTRILAKKFGSFLTFAALEAGAESASGQPTIADLRELYRWDAVDERTRLFGVVGWPVAHSRGPRLHNAVMAAEGIDGVYLPLPVCPTYEALAAFLDYVADADWLDCAGFSVTLPHKEHARRWLVERGGALDDRAARAGAVNTLFRDAAGDWRGANTDAAGALAALQSVPELAGDGLHGQSVDILGAGGVAHAAAAVLAEHRCRIMVYNRAPERAAELARCCDGAWQPWDRREAGTGRILINCTSVGMVPDVDATPISAARCGPDTIVFDTVYQPAETRLLREAQARGSRVINGVTLFIAQAAEQIRIWHGLEADPWRIKRFGNLFDG